MRLASVFRSDKGIYPDKFPKPPTSREMLEDIGSMTHDDPIIVFTNALLKKGRGRRDSVSSVTADDVTAELESCDNASPTTTHDWINSSLAKAVVRDIKAKGHHTPKSLSRDSLHRTPSFDDPSDVHTRLKAFSSLCTKSEDLTGNVETRLKQMEAQCYQIIENTKN